MTRPNFFETAIATIAPGYAVRRELARRQLRAFGYDAARTTRHRATIPTFRPSESSSNQSDRVAMMKRARDLEENFAIVRSILRKLETYCFSTFRYQARTGDAAVDAKYEEYIAFCWRVADITGRHTFRNLCALSLTSVWRDGDVGYLVIPGAEDGTLPPRIQAIEADRIGGISTNTTSKNSFGGIKVDDYGRPISYEVWDRTPNGQYDNKREIPAISFLHVFDPMRLDQYRGITAFHACANTLQDMREILDFEKEAVKWGATMAGVIESEAGEDLSGYSFDQTTQDLGGNTLSLQNVQSGALMHLAKGEKASMFKNDRPSTTFTGFIETLIREVALSVDLPYGFVYDLARLGGPTSRMDSAQAQRTIARAQNLIVERLVDPMLARWLAYGQEHGAIPEHKNWLRRELTGPAWPTIDVGRESAAAVNENKAGLRTKQSWYAEQGLDFEEQAAQLEKEARDTIARAQKIAADTGVDLSVALNLMEMRGPNGLMPQQKPVDAEPVAKEEE